MGKPSERRSDLAASQSGDEDAWDGESFERVSLKGKETKCALYPGYTDLGQFRRYLCSCPLLRYFLSWAKNHGGPAFRENPIFRLIVIAYKTDTLEKKCGKTIEDLLGRYTTNEESDNKIGSQQVLAGLIYQLMHYAEVYNPEIRAKIAGQFAENFPDTKLPTLDEAPLTPKWEPFPGGLG